MSATYRPEGRHFGDRGPAQANVVAALGARAPFPPRLVQRALARSLSLDATYRLLSVSDADKVREEHHDGGRA